MTNKGLELIKQFEGFESKAYKCSAGVWTIGYGATYYMNGTPVKEGDTITLEELSHVYAYNQSYLSRIIKENCKMNFLELLRESRLEKASILLSSSDFSVDQIAQMVGYQNAVPIYQGIKEKFGCSPSEYRKCYGKTNIDDSINQ